MNNRFDATPTRLQREMRSDVWSADHIDVGRASSSTWRRVRLAVLERDKFICYRCGKYAVEIDHLWPAALGGDDHPEGLRACCRRCNAKQGTKPDGDPPTQLRLW